MADDNNKTRAQIEVEWAKEDERKKGEGPSVYARRLQDNAENRKQVLPGLTVNEDGKMVQLTPEERESSSKTKSKKDTRTSNESSKTDTHSGSESSKTDTRTSGEPGFRLRK